MNKKYYDEFIETLLHMKTKQEMDAFLHGMLTPLERVELPKRLAIFKMLSKGIPQHEIASKVGVGVATVTRGSLELQRGKIQKTSWWQSLSTHMGG